MDTTTSAPEDRDRIGLVRVLMLVQAGVITLAVVESGVWALGSPTLIVVTLVNVGALLWTLRLRAGVGRGSERSRRWTRRVELAWMLVALLDLGLALWLAQRALEPVALVTRLVLPWGIRRLLETPFAVMLPPPPPTRWAAVPPPPPPAPVGLAEQVRS